MVGVRGGGVGRDGDRGRGTTGGVARGQKRLEMCTVLHRVVYVYSMYL